MQHFFVTPSQVKEDVIIIEGSDVNHMKNVLRMHPGEEVTISDGPRGITASILLIFSSFICSIERLILVQTSSKVSSLSLAIS